MPAAKKRTTRRTTKTSGDGPVTRQEVEDAAARFEKALDDAGQALQAMGANLGRNAKTTYKGVERTLRTLRTDARKANSSVMKDMQKLWASAGTSSTATAKGAAKKRTAKKATAKKATAKKATAKSSTTGRVSAGKSTTVNKSSAAKKRAASGSKGRRGS